MCGTINESNTKCYDELRKYYYYTRIDLAKKLLLMYVSFAQAQVYGVASGEQ